LHATTYEKNGGGGGLECQPFKKIAKQKRLWQNWYISIPFTIIANFQSQLKPKKTMMKVELSKSIFT
jgi:hypothetical protein